MMSAPPARTSARCMALTVACVPPGMKAGVRTMPCAVVISPWRAARSVEKRRKPKCSSWSIRGRLLLGREAYHDFAKRKRFAATAVGRAGKGATYPPKPAFGRRRTRRARRHKYGKWRARFALPALHPWLPRPDHRLLDRLAVVRQHARPHQDVLPFLRRQTA